MKSIPLVVMLALAALVPPLSAREADGSVEGRIRFHVASAHHGKGEAKYVAEIQLDEPAKKGRPVIKRFMVYSDDELVARNGTLGSGDKIKLTAEQAKLFAGTSDLKRFSELKHLEIVEKGPPRAEHARKAPAPRAADDRARRTTPADSPPGQTAPQKK